jgi:hypothetical protein
MRQIAFGTPEYELARRLREEVLRKPLGLSLTDEDLEGEEHQLHFGLFESSGELVACGVAVPISRTEARIRQMAVLPSRQGTGLGGRLLEEIENDLRTRGFRTLVLDARTSAAGFYERLGYSALGEEFIHVTIPHIRMSKAV